MKGDIALAGFVMTAEEWEELDPPSRAQLLAIAYRRDDPWIVAGITGVLADPQYEGGPETDETIS